MSDLPLHPLLVHLPLGLAVAVPLLAAWVARTAWRGGGREGLGILAGLQALLVVGALAAMQAGEAEEERVEERVPEALLEVHEERAEAFTWTAAATLVFWVGAVLGAGRRPGRALFAAAAAGSVAVLGLAVATGEAGGRIVHGPDGLVHAGAPDAGWREAPAVAHPFGRRLREGGEHEEEEHE